MSEIEQANGIEIPAEALRAAEGELWVDFGLNVQGIEEAIRGALDTWGATVERNDTSRLWKPDVVKYRIVTAWREVP